MSDKRDREVRKLFNIAQANSAEMQNDPNNDNLTPHEIFIGSCKMALEANEEAPYPLTSPVASVDKKNFAFSLEKNDAIIIANEEDFDLLLQDLDWSIDDLED